MAIILTIKERILTFLDAKGVKKVDFFEESGIQSSNFKGKNKYSQPGGDMLVKILTLYPDLSAEWLMRGEGSMFRDNTSIDNVTAYEKTSEKPDVIIDDSSDSPIVDKFLTIIREQSEEIGRLKARITQLESQQGGNAYGVHSSGTANAG